MKKFITYCRVSTKMQGRSGLGMESQTEIVRTFVERAEGQIISEFCEVESGSKSDFQRPQLALALSECRKHGATLVCAKLDRLSRNAEFLIRLRNSNVDLVFCDNPHLDKFTCGILALVAEKEREMCSLRTIAALKAARNRGIRLGNPNPERSVELMVAGNRRGKEEFAKKILPIVLEIKSTGIHSLSGIATCLNRRGIETRNGKKWFPASVKNLLG